MAEKVSIASVRKELTAKGFIENVLIRYRGKEIGRVVRYGKHVKRGKGMKLESRLASRIYNGPVKIEEEAGSTDRLLDKVAKVLAAAIKAGTWKEEA